MSIPVAQLVVMVESQTTNAERGLAKVNRQVNDSGGAMGYLRDVSKEAVGTMAGFVGAQAVISGFRTAISTTVGEAISFESAWAGVLKTVDGTDDELGALRQGIIDMGNQLPATREEIAGVAEAAGQLGIELPNIEAFTRTMVDLGESTNLSSEEAATSLARLANITQMPQTEFDRLGSTIVELGNNLATTEAEIVAMGLRLAGAGSQVGFTEAQILGVAGALSSVGIEAEAGGTAVSKVMIELAQAVSSGGDALSNFAGVAGMTSDEFARKWGEDAPGALVAFVSGLGRVSDEGGNLFAVLENLGITEVRMRDAMLRMSGAGDLLATSLGLASDAWEENTALAEEAEKRYETTAARLAIFRNQATNVARVIGERLVRGLMDGSSWLADRFAPAATEARRMLEAFWPVIRPVVQGLAAFGGGLVVGGLIVLAETLETVFGFLADNREMVLALGAAYAVTLIPRIVETGTAMVSAGFDKFAGWAYDAAGGVDQMAGRITAARVATAGMAAGVGMLVAGWLESKRAAEEYARSVTAPYDLSSFEGIEAAYDANYQALAAANEESERWRSSGATDWGGQLREVAGGLQYFGSVLPGVDATIRDSHNAVLAHAGEAERLQQMYRDLSDVYVRTWTETFGRDLGYTPLFDVIEADFGKIELLAREAGISLTGVAEVDVPKLVDAFDAMAVETGDAEQALEALMGIEMTPWAEDMGKAMQQAAQSIFDFSDEAKTNLWTFQSDLRENIADLYAWQTNIATIAERGGGEFATQIAQLGPEYSEMVAQLANTTDTDFRETMDLMGFYTDLAAQDMVGHIAGLSGEVAPPAEEAGAAAAAGVATGFENEADDAKDRISNATTKFVDAIKDKLWIRSPSRLMAVEIGAPMAQGITEGIIGQRSAVAAAVASLVPESPEVRSWGAEVARPQFATQTAGEASAGRSVKVEHNYNGVPVEDAVMEATHRTLRDLERIESEVV